MENDVTRAPGRGADARLRASRRCAVLAVTLAVLAACCFASLAWGSSVISLPRVWELLWHPDGSNEAYNVRGLRVTRTIVGVLVGVSLAVAGAVMQAVTHNPLADPGLLGANAGASLAIVAGSAFGGWNEPASQIALAAFGAALATVMVYAVGAVGAGGASPARLVLAGAALSAGAGGIVSVILLRYPATFDTFRFWDVGALTRTDMPLQIVLIPIIAGLALVGAIVPGLSDMALGDDVAAALGTNVALTRGLSLIAITLLCASATALAGPLSYVGLVVPVFAQWVMGAHRGWILALCAVLGPCLVLSADVVGRLLARPSEMAVGLLTAFVGAPMLLVMVFRLQGDAR